MRVFLTFKSFPSTTHKDTGHTISPNIFLRAHAPVRQARQDTRRGINDTRASRRIERRTTPNIGRERTDMKATEETRKRSSDWIVDASGGNLSVEFGILRRVFPLFLPMNTLHKRRILPFSTYTLRVPMCIRILFFSLSFFTSFPLLLFSLSSSPNRYSLSTTVGASLVHAHLFNAYVCARDAYLIPSSRQSPHARWRHAGRRGVDNEMARVFLGTLDR